MRSQFFLPTLLVLAGCNAGKNHVTYENQLIDGKQTIVMRKFDASAGLILEEQFNRDSVNDGWHREYDHGRLKCLGYYSNGKKDSTWTYFGRFGNILRTENWFGGKQFGEQLKYFSKNSDTGKSVLQVYGFNNLDGERYCNIYFDSNDRFVSASRAPFYFAYNRDSIDQGSDLELICVFGAPPGFGCHLKFGESDVAHQRRLSTMSVDDTSAAVQHLYFGRKLLYTQRYQRKGVYQWTFDFSVTNASQQVMARDTMSLLVRVK